MNHKLTTYCRLMKNREVKWLNNYTQKYNRIPSHYILVIQNSNLIKSNNINLSKSFGFPSFVYAHLSISSRLNVNFKPV